MSSLIPVALVSQLQCTLVHLLLEMLPTLTQLYRVKIWTRSKSDQLYQQRRFTELGHNTLFTLNALRRFYHFAESIQLFPLRIWNVKPSQPLCVEHFTSKVTNPLIQGKKNYLLRFCSWKVASVTQPSSTDATSFFHEQLIQSANAHDDGRLSSAVFDSTLTYDSFRESTNIYISTRGGGGGYTNALWKTISRQRRLLTLTIRNS